jgi:hypothetical protein
VNDGMPHFLRAVNDRLPAVICKSDGHHDSHYLRVHWAPCKAFTAAVRSFRFLVS